MIRGLLRAGVLASCLTGSGLCEAVAAPQWRMLETPRFTVFSQSPERETRAWAEEFNQFIEALKVLIKVDDSNLPPLSVVIFNREKDFARFRPLDGAGKPKDWIAGWFSNQEMWSVSAMVDNWHEESMRRVILHEGVHWFLSGESRRLPLWFQEGIAEVFSSFAIENKKGKWGDPIASHLHLLSRREMLPFEEFLHLTRENSLFNEADRTGVFYAQSWAFVHYLIFGARKNAQGSLGEFLEAYYGSGSTGEAFQKVFGQDYEGMRRALESYLSGGRCRLYSQALSESAKVTAPFVPAPPALVQVAMAKMAFSSNDMPGARAFAEEAVRLDQTCLEARKILAWTHANDEQPDLYLDAATAAAQFGPKDAEALVVFAAARARMARSKGGLPPKEARQIVNLLERAINQRPCIRRAYAWLADVVQHLESINDQDNLFLEQGRALFPDEPLIALGYIHVLRKQGQKEQARTLLHDLCEKPGGASLEQLKHFKRVHAHWDLEDTMGQARTHIKNKAYKEAMLLLEPLMKRDAFFIGRESILNTYWSAAAEAALADAAKALCEGKKQEAARLYKSVLAMSLAPGFNKDFAREELEKLQAAEAHPGDAAPPSSASKE